MWAREMIATLGYEEGMKRVARAMETLNRYGPEARLSRLNEADPEIATQIEYLLSLQPDKQRQTISTP